MVTIYPTADTSHPAPRPCHSPMHSQEHTSPLPSPPPHPLAPETSPAASSRSRRRRHARTRILHLQAIRGTHDRRRVRSGCAAAGTSPTGTSPTGPRPPAVQAGAGAEARAVQAGRWAWPFLKSLGPGQQPQSQLSWQGLVDTEAVAEEGCHGSALSTQLRHLPPLCSLLPSAHGASQEGHIYIKHQWAAAGTGAGARPPMVGTRRRQRDMLRKLRSRGG